MECYTSKAKVLGLLGLTCIMVGASFVVTRLPDVDVVVQVIGWVGVALFGLGFIAFPATFFRRGPQVVIDDEGFDDRRTKMGIIRWEDIRTISIRTVHSTKFLCFELVDPQKYVSRLPRWQRVLASANQPMGFGDLSIGLGGLSPGVDEVWAHLQTRQPRMAGSRGA